MVEQLAHALNIEGSNLDAAGAGREKKSEGGYLWIATFVVVFEKFKFSVIIAISNMSVQQNLCHRQWQTGKQQGYKNAEHSSLLHGRTVSSWSKMLRVQI
jgi:hypothetical protein